LSQATDENQLLLATLPPSKGQIRLALCVVTVLFSVVILMLPFADTQLPRVDAFIPVLETAIVFNDLITASLLFAQFFIVRQWALLVLASGFLYTALIVIPHALTFPGAFAPAGLLGAGLQSPPWLYIFWHAGSPIAVIGYVLLRDLDQRTNTSQRSPALLIGWSVAVVISMVFVLTWLAIRADEFLPSLFVNVRDANRIPFLLTGEFLALLNAATLVLLWSKRRTVLDLWLMVMCCAWLAETVVLGYAPGRFTVRFYGGRIYAFVAVFTVLLILLSETTVLYANLVHSALRRRSGREGRQIAIDTMAASIAHEVSQPVGAIGLNSSAALMALAKTPPDIDEARAAVDAISDDTTRMANVIASLRAMYKSDAHKREHFDVNELLREVLTVVDVDVLTQRVSVSTELCETLPHLLADRIQLRQVFLNLCMNAIEAMRAVTDRSRQLRIRSEFIQEPFGVLVAVEDSGPGIGSKDEERIFEPFYSTKSTGMGIGLAICRSIIESHGGHLRASGNRPHGAIFHVALPAGE
jgi:signal transduction histidine kinase